MVVWISRVGLIVVLLTIWELSSGTLIDPFWISSPSEIAVYITKGVDAGFLITDIRITVTEAAVGYVLGAALGIIFGLTLARSQRLAAVFQPFIVAIYGIPRIALAPLFIVWFGIGYISKLALVVMVVFFLVFFSTFDGVRALDPNHLRVARVMGASDLLITTKVVIPGTMPWIFTGLKLSVPLSMVGAIVGEFIASTGGLGYRIRREAAFFSTEGSMGVVFIIMVLVILANSLVSAAERRVLRWRPADDAVVSAAP